MHFLLQIPGSLLSVLVKDWKVLGSQQLKKKKKCLKKKEKKIKRGEMGIKKKDKRYKNRHVGGRTVNHLQTYAG